ncbi:uncharacterized protein LOC135090754 isoform X3 [Scylla paramamosain]|uniref:uncharacterized protein LOC135090754 isoform X3 n=1 Tax=Scylla paramamosain TaxID=85552 RepID=UPI0030838D56
MHTAVSGRRSILTGAGSVSVVSDSHLGWESSPQQSISLHPHPQHSDHENVPADVSTAPTTAAAAEPRPGCCSTRARCLALLPMTRRRPYALAYPHGVPGAEPGVQGRATQPPILLG